LNFDLVTGFSLAPLQLFSLVGIALSLASAAFVVYLAVRRWSSARKRRAIHVVWD